MDNSIRNIEATKWKLSFTEPTNLDTDTDQGPSQKPKIEAIKDILEYHSELSIERDKIVMKRYIEPAEVFYKVRDELDRKGWKYIDKKQIGKDKLEPAYFDFRRGRYDCH